MKNIPIPTINAQSVFEEFINAKRVVRPTLLAIKPRVLSQYDLYNKNAQNLEVLEAFDGFGEDGKAALNHCYDSSIRPLNNLKTTIYSNLGDVGISFCPYCLISEPKTIDHYLPKELYPEFSVLPCNLIPCCPTCNSKRGLIWLKSDKRTTINVYFDILENRRFLFAEVYFESDGIPQINFYIKNMEGLSDYLFEIINNHFDKLKLYQRYRDQIARIVSELYTLYSKPAHASLPNKSTAILEQAETDRNIHGANYWKAAVFEALGNSEQFINSLQKS